MKSKKFFKILQIWIVGISIGLIIGGTITLLFNMNSEIHTNNPEYIPQNNYNQRYHRFIE